MFKIRNIAIALGFVISACGIFAAQNQNPNYQPISNKPATIKTEDAIQRININTTDVVTLQKIKGFGKKKAEAIIEYRSKNGIFKSIEEMLKVKARGLNQKWLDKISKFLTV